MFELRCTLEGYLREDGGYGSIKKPGNLIIGPYKLEPVKWRESLIFPGLLIVTYRNETVTPTEVLPYLKEAGWEL